MHGTHLGAPEQTGCSGFLSECSVCTCCPLKSLPQEAGNLKPRDATQRRGRNRWDLYWKLQSTSHFLFPGLHPVRWSQQAPLSPLLPPHSRMPGTKANFLSPLSSPYVDHTFLFLGAGCGRGPYEAGGNRDETGPQKVERKPLLVPPSLSEYAQILP